MRTNKILTKVAVMLTVLMVVLIVYYFITTKTAFDGSWKHTYSRGLILFLCILWLTLLFFEKFNVKNRKIQQDISSEIVEINYELTPDENDFVEFFISYAKNKRITKNYLEDFFYDNFRFLTLEYSTKNKGDIFSINNVAEVIKRAKEKYHDH